MKKKIMCFLLASIFCLSAVGMLGGCGFGNCEVGLRLYENEYFIYTLSYDGPRIRILGLTDKGKEQEYLVIPETIDGKKVTSVGYVTAYDASKIKEKYGDEKYALFQSDCLKKVFVVPKLTVTNGVFFESASNQLSVLYISNDTHVQKNMNRYDYYFTKENNAISTDGSRKHLANVSYYYNYDDSNNDGYYWIDNYGYGETIEYIPEQPIRDGCMFDGWYKEPECINKWNFETDTLPQAQYNEEGKELYQETKLYAKWI